MTSTTSAEHVFQFLELADAANIRIVIDGGWGVDALLQEQTRPHSDLDVILDVNDSLELKRLCLRNGYSELPDGTSSNYLLKDASGGRIDVHAITFDDRGFGVFQFPDGRRWPFPRSAFQGEGSIADRTVICLSPDAQVQCHGQGYTPTPKDIEDMRKIQEKFGVVLPISLCRQEERREEN